MTTTEIDTEAKKLFRIYHGKGDGGSEREFYAQHPEQWRTLARHVLRRLKKAQEPIYGPRSEDC